MLYIKSIGFYGKIKNKKQNGMRTVLKLGVILVLAFCPIQKLLAADQLGGNFDISANAKSGQLNFVSAKDPSSPLWKTKTKGSRQANARRFLGDFGKYFGVSRPDNFKFIKERQDREGNSHLRYNQTYQGVPVLGGQLIVHLKNSQEVTAVNGQVNPIAGLGVEPEISADKAFELAKEQWGELEGELRQLGKPKLFVYNKSFIKKDPDAKNYLVWQLDLSSLKPFKHELFFIDALDGNLVDHHNVIKKAVDRRVYNCRAWASYSNCTLTDPANGGANPGRVEGGAATGISDIDDLYSYTGSVHNYYVGTFARDGANDAGGLGDGTANLYTKTDSYGHVDWDPYRGYYCPDNAYFEDSAFYGGATINFCDDSGTKDVVGHEYGHGMSYYSILDAYGDYSGLIYEYESGAIEEGNADVFGEALENNINGSSDWLLGEDIASGPFRSMSDPASLGYPDRFNSANFYCGYGDNGGVHINSTVIGHAAYLMAVGGTFNGCSINAMGRAKEEAIFYKAIQDYLTNNSGFNEAYTALNAACAILYGGAGSADCLNVKKALRSVELDQGGACSGIPATTPQCDFTLAPTVSSITSSVASGSYGVGSIIGIIVNFSEPVTSTGNVTVNLNSGGSCSFNVTTNSQGSCNYTVGAGQSANPLSVSSISGTLVDSDGNSMSNFAPAINLSQSKNIIIDNDVPVISGVSEGQIYRTDVAPTFNEGTATLNGIAFTSGQTISQDGNYTLIVTDGTGNSAQVSFTIEKITSSLSSFLYSRKRNIQRISFTVYNVSLPGKLKASKFRVRLNGRRVKISSVRNGGSYLVINTRQNYRKWPAGAYNFTYSYNFKVKKARYQGSASKDSLLTIQ